MTKKNITIEETYAFAVQNHKKNNLKLAEELYEEILKINPKHFESIFLLGTLSIQLNKIDTARQLFQKAIQIKPDHANANYNFGNVLKSIGEYNKAISHYQKAIQINPNFIEAHNNLGVAYREVRQLQKAKNCYEKVIEIQPNNSRAHSNLGNVMNELGENEKSIHYLKKALEIKPDLIEAQRSISSFYITKLDNIKKTISESYKTLRMHHDASKFINQKISLYRLKHDVQQAEYLSLKNYKINGAEQFQEIGNKILKNKEKRENNNNLNQKILLSDNEIKSLLPYYKINYIYQTQKISTSCINPYKNWQNVEEQYFNSPNQIIYIDDFLSDEAIKELREFCLVSKVWNEEYHNKYLGAFSDKGFISKIHLQIAIELQQKLPRLFGPYGLTKFWGFKYDSTLGKGINVHADQAIHNLNFWITPDEYNKNKNSGGLKVYDAIAPEDWNFEEYNKNADKIYKFLNDNNANCTNINYKFNRAVLFNSDYFHETDEINFDEGYETRRINITYLFGYRFNKKMN